MLGNFAGKKGKSASIKTISRIPKTTVRLDAALFPNASKFFLSTKTVANGPPKNALATTWTGE